MKGGNIEVNNVIEAMKKGWMILEVAKVLARGGNDEGRGYLVTLAEPSNHTLHKLYLPYSSEVEAFLNRASLP
jgi:hypothetical protein